LDTVEAGLVLKGAEIKSIRGHKVSLSDSYARPRDGQMWLHNLHIDEYAPASRNNHDPKRLRKLLLHRAQIEDLSSQIDQKGLTLVPLRLYIRNHVAKVELALARGKKRFDKRRALIEREREREARAAIGRQ
jgi:SsrA-binding protein